MASTIDAAASAETGGLSPAVELRRPAMGTMAQLRVVTGADDRPLATALLLRLDQRLEQLEERWSRFRSHSEVSRLNSSCGDAISVSEDTQRLVSTAVDAWRFTDGDFDPSVFGSLLALGYDRSFERLHETSRRRGPFPASTGPAPGCAEIRVDPVAGLVRIPEGCGFDPGGIGKGLAADLLAEEAMACGARGVLINVGGDLRMAGECDDGLEGWLVEVAQPGRADHVHVSLAEGAVASSTPLRRRWHLAGAAHHHLLDPRSGSSTGAAAPHLVTVVAAEGWVAELLTKALHVRWSRDPERVLDDCGSLLGPTGASALVLDTHGQRHLLGRMEDYLS